MYANDINNDGEYGANPGRPYQDQRQHQYYYDQQQELSSPYNSGGGGYQQQQQQQQQNDSPYRTGGQYGMGGMNNQNSNRTFSDPFALSGGSRPGPSTQNQGYGGGINTNQMFQAAASVMGNFDGQINPVQQIALEQTRQFVGGNLEKLAPGMTGLWGSLKFYFSVDNHYVVKKLGLILFPFRHRDWHRTPAHSDETNRPVFCTPMLDVNCPDLYIPTMAFVTYILLMGLLKGQSMKFTPETLSETFSSSLLTQVFEFLWMIGGKSALGQVASDTSWMDLLIYTGYKYVGVALNLFVGIFFGSVLYNAVLIYTAACSSYMMFYTLKSSIPAPGEGESGRKRRLYYLISVSTLEAATMWYLGRNSEMSDELPRVFASMFASFSGPSSG